MTISIDPIKTSIETKYLYDMDETMVGLTVCKIIGISAYKGFPLTFHVLVEDKYMFSNIPIFAFGGTKSDIFDDSLCYINCPSNHIDVFSLDYLKSKKAKCYFKFEARWVNIEEYYYTIDFYNDNELLHFVLLSNGRYAFVPNHKINFGNTEHLPNYKKNHQNWLI